MLTRRVTPDHAEERIGLHAENFQHCVRMVEQHRAGRPLADQDWRGLERMERQHRLFQDLDPGVFWRGLTRTRPTPHAPMVPFPLVRASHAPAETPVTTKPYGSPRPAPSRGFLGETP